MGYKERQDRVLEAGAQVFAERGYHRASLREVARALPISLAGLYYYAPSKQELLFRIVSQALDSILTALELSLPANASAEQRLHALVRHHFEFFSSHMAAMKVLSHESGLLEGEFKVAIERQKRAYYQRVRGLLQELQPELGAAELRVAALALLGMINWIYTWYRPERDPPAAALARRMVELFLRGFKADPPTFERAASGLLQESL